MPLNQTLRKNSNVLWTISIIQDQNPTAQTKSEFGEMANDVLTTPTIDTVTLCLADNLQRFRLMIEDGSSEEEAIQKCQELAKQWQYDNSESIQKLKEGKKLSSLKWEEFRNWTQYEQTLQELENWYKENRDFRMAVDGRVRQARENIKEDAKISDPLKQTELLKRYLLEECAFQKFGATKGFNYEIYKTQQSKAMRRVKNNNDFVPPGVMVEVHFTQFNSPAKKHEEIKKENLSTHYNTPLIGLDFPPTYIQKTTRHYPAEHDLPNRASFTPVFKTSSSKSLPVEPNLSTKTAEFIEKTLALLPLHHQEKAAQALIKFATQEIIPLCYENKITLVNT